MGQPHRGQQLINQVLQGRIIHPLHGLGDLAQDGMTEGQDWALTGVWKDRGHRRSGQVFRQIIDWHDGSLSGLAHYLSPIIVAIL